MGDLARLSPETELALLRQRVEAVHTQLETNNDKLQQVIDSMHRIELDNKSLYMTEKHHRERLDGIDETLKKHVRHIDGLELTSSKLHGGLSVAKWAFGVVSGIAWALFSGFMYEAYQEIKITHDIAILNKQDIQRLAERTEEKRQ